MREKMDSNRAHKTLDIESYWMPDSNADWNDWMIGREFSEKLKILPN